MPQDKQCKHDYYKGECFHCGLLKSTIESMEKPEWHDSKHVKTLSEHTPTSTKTWRENLHRTIQEIMYPKKGADGKFLMKIPPVIIDAIDAAYTAGLDDREKVVSKTEEESEKEEWGGWKFVSEMLDNPNEYGIYPTSKCYKQLYDFVVEQKAKAFKAGEALGQQNGMRMVGNDILEKITRTSMSQGEYEGIKNFVRNKFNL